MTFCWDRGDIENKKILKNETFILKTIDMTKFYKLRIISIAFKALILNKSFAVYKYRSKKMIKMINLLLKENKYDIVHFDHMHMAQYYKYFPNTLKILDQHNIEHIIWKRYFETEKNIFKKKLIYFQWKALKKNESLVASKMDLCMTVSNEDKKNLELISPKTNIFVSPNGVDLKYFKKNTNIQKKKDTIVFTGSMNWLPNKDGILFFLNDIFPHILKPKPDTILYIVGQNPSEELKRYASKNVIITGWVDDTRPYIDMSSLFIVPLRIGGGTRLKILEAMAMEIPIISTSIGSEGINVENGKNIIIEDNPNLFAKKVISLLNNDINNNELIENGVKLVKEHYSWDKITDTIALEYGKILNNS